MTGFQEIQNQNFSVDLPQYEKQKGHWGIYIFGVDSRGTYTVLTLGERGTLP